MESLWANKIWEEIYLIQHPVQLIPSLNNTISIVAVNHKDKALGVLEVVPPQRPDLLFEII